MDLQVPSLLSSGEGLAALATPATLPWACLGRASCRLLLIKINIHLSNMMLPSLRAPQLAEGIYFQTLEAFQSFNWLLKTWDSKLDVLDK